MAACSSRTERLQFESLEARHAAALFPVLDDARIYAFVPTERAPSVDALEASFARMAAGPPETAGERWYNWAVREIGDGAYLGTVQATVITGDCAWVGYLLTPSAWGKGYGGEACAWLIEVLGRELRVERVRASVDSRNQASCRLLERLGFVHDSTEPCVLHGLATTDFHYSLQLAVPRR